MLTPIFRILKACSTNKSHTKYLLKMGFVESGGARLATVDAVQVVGVVDGGAALLTQGPAGVFWRGGDDDRTGRFRSPAKQFTQPVHFGEYRVEPSSDDLRIRFRSGVSAAPDGTWLEWSPWLPAARGRVPLPPARSLQWELEIPANSGGSPVDRIEVAVVEVNLPPRIKKLEVKEPGVVYLAAPPASGPVAAETVKWANSSRLSVLCMALDIRYSSEASR